MAYNLERFLRAQERDYETALQEVSNGRKESHWIWYIFPQLSSLGRSDMAIYFGLSGMEEASAYLAHPVLGERLVEISKALTWQAERDPARIFGYPDVMKVRSCMTLFSAVEGADPIFQQVLDEFYGGERDARTDELLQAAQ